MVSDAKVFARSLKQNDEVFQFDGKQISGKFEFQAIQGPNQHKLEYEEMCVNAAILMLQIPFTPNNGHQ